MVSLDWSNLGILTARGGRDQARVGWRTGGARSVGSYQPVTSCQLRVGQLPVAGVWPSADSLTDY